MDFRNKIYFKWKQLYCLSSLIWVFLISACILNQTPGPIGVDSETPNLTHSGLWIANEGGFTLGQASLSFLDLVEDTLYNNVFETINGRPLGDVLQSISYYKGKMYLIVNNSRKIEVVDSLTLLSIETIGNLDSPRELIGYKDKLFVTNLYSNAIDVFDANDYSLIDRIETEGWNENMLIYKDQLFVTQRQTFTNNIPGSLKGLWVFDVKTHIQLGFIPLAQGANSLVLDKNNKIWVLCDGGLEEEIGGLYRIDPETYSEEAYYPFINIEYTASLLKMNSTKKELYFILSDPEDGLNAYDIIKMNIEENSLPSEPFYDGGQLYLYGYYIDEIRQEMFFTDAVGLVQEGFCYRINLIDKSFISNYQTGIFPGQIYSNY